MGKSKVFERIFRGLIYIAPAMLFCSYLPTIYLGASGTMNFELSLALIWLLIFDIVAFLVMIFRREFSKFFKFEWGIFGFLGFLTVSVLWSENFLRGLLTAGILWLIFFAGYAIVRLKELFNSAVRRRFWRWFFGTGLVFVLVMILQCILDLAGVSAEITGMCDGCTYAMFGFSHPNGFAIEPQFMGNLLLVPALVSAGFLVFSREKILAEKKGFRKYFGLLISFGIFSFGIFLTFSRGAIYAFALALVLMGIIAIFRKVGKRSLMIFGVMILTFLITLGTQGLMAEVSRTDDTFYTGISKVVNHLSLGIIELPEETVEEVVVFDEGAEEVSNSNSEEISVFGSEEAVFDGYVEESTNTRLRLTNAAIEVWRRNVFTMLFGVGLGGAGQALYNNGLSPAPREIVQNEYASLLLEAGICGILLLIVVVILVFMAVRKKSKAGMMFLILAFAFAITIGFFSGVTNVLHIYILPVLIFEMMKKGEKKSQIS